MGRWIKESTQEWQTCLREGDQKMVLFRGQTKVCVGGGKSPILLVNFTHGDYIWQISKEIHFDFGPRKPL